jgi:hypothetical protein
MSRSLKPRVETEQVHGMSRRRRENYKVIRSLKWVRRHIQLDSDSE